MSSIASAWVATIKVGNQTAKQLLQFYASHNFGRPGFEFKNSTLANQLEVSERAIQLAHQLLIEKNLITKEIRFNKEGRQLTNAFYLNIPQEFVDNFLGENRKAAPVDKSGGEGERSSPLLNNNINNKFNNKSFCETPEQKKANQMKTRSDWKEANQKKHTWAEAGKESPLADVTKQSTSYGYQSETPEESQRRFEERMRYLQATG